MGSTNYVRFGNLFEMWKRLNWLYKGTSLGCGVKFVYSDDNKSLFTRVWNDAKSKTNAEIHTTKEFVPYSVFNATVKGKALNQMSALNDLRKEYLELQSIFNDAKWYNTTYNTVQVITDSGDSQLVCECGNDEIFVISPHTHLKHLGVTKDDIFGEFDKADSETGNGLYSNDDYDYSADADLNKEIKREYSDHRIYNETVNAHRAESEFYAMAGSMTIGQVCKKLGKHKSNMIADQIAEYYSTKMSL